MLKAEPFNWSLKHLLCCTLDDGWFSALTLFKKPFNMVAIRRRIEQLAARRAHNPEVVGSSPTPAIKRFAKANRFFFEVLK